MCVRVYTCAFLRKGITISAFMPHNGPPMKVPEPAGVRLAGFPQMFRGDKNKKRSDSHGQLLLTNNLY